MLSSWNRKDNTERSRATKFLIPKIFLKHIELFLKHTPSMARKILKENGQMVI
jgi:hypothetical protein